MRRLRLWRSPPTTSNDLRRCVELARRRLEEGDEPFGSVLVDADGEDPVRGPQPGQRGDATRHPEFAIARWAAENVTAGAAHRTTVYTSGEHCPMCSAAHAWVGLGRIVYAASRHSCAWRDRVGSPRVTRCAAADHDRGAPASSRRARHRIRATR